jgi:hypothetical protein
VRYQVSSSPAVLFTINKEKEKSMKAENIAVLMQAKQKAIKHKPKVCVTVTQTKDDGREAWSRFKSECVLLTKKGGAR